MGDFFLLDLERRIEPIVLHFVNAPEALGARRLAGRGALRRELPRLVPRLALAGLGRGARGAGVAADPAAADPRQARLRRAPRFIYRRRRHLLIFS